MSSLQCATKWRRPKAAPDTQVQAGTLLLTIPVMAVPAAPSVATVDRAAIDRRAVVGRNMVRPVIVMMPIACGVGRGDRCDSAEQAGDGGRSSGVATPMPGVGRGGTERGER